MDRLKAALAALRLIHEPNVNEAHARGEEASAMVELCDSFDAYLDTQVNNGANGA